MSIQRALSTVKRLREEMGAIQAVAVMTQNHHAESHRLNWLHEIEGRARRALHPDPGEEA